MDETTRRGAASAQDLDETIAAVEGIGRELNAVTSVMGDRARTLARRSAERTAAGEPPRRLEGVPFAIKDVIDVAGFPTTMGSRVSSGPEPSVTAPVVHLLERAGAIPVAKTNCQEYSYGILGDESAFGRVINPIDPALCTGGSSSGSAALVASGVVPLAVGTDTAGSVRVPAACQSVFGFKPTFGAISTEGVFPLSPSFDTVGLFAREIPLIAAAFDAIAGRGSVGADSGAEAEVGEAASRATITVDTGLLDSAGVFADDGRGWVRENLTEGRLNPTEMRRHRGEIRTTSAISDDLLTVIDEGLAVYDIVRRYEAFVLHEQYLDEQGEAYQPGVWAKILSGQSIAEAEYRSQVAALEEFRASAVSFFDEVDFIVTPAIEGDVIRWDEIDDGSAAKFMCCSLPFNVLGWPAVTLPVRREPGVGRPPVSVQIVGPPHEDRALLEFAAGL
ncbi:amidase [Brevibacterium atlanticum]|uniref:amidase n=1 Tax=Brevibacterium atlanticum TaxID=2697563 RepID=UPI0014232F01|nr:amidase [Brevibacterium atlanticum]